MPEVWRLAQCRRSETEEIGGPKMANGILDVKRAAVVKRLKEATPMLPTLASMWDEKTIDMLVLILGIGHIELNQ